MAKKFNKPMQADGVQGPGETPAPDDVAPVLMTADPPPAPEPPPGFEVRVQHAATMRCREIAPGTWHVWDPLGKAAGDVEAEDPYEAYKAFLGMTSSSYKPEIVPLAGV